MEIKLDKFESIGEEYAKKLEEMGITSIDTFFEFTIDQIQSKLGIERNRVEKWRDMLELYTVPGITPRDAELLYSININSVEELSHRQAVRIYYGLQEIDKNSYLIIIDLPTFRTIDTWIYYAKLLTKRTKFGLNIPLIKMPMITHENSVEFQKYQVITVEELLIKNEVNKSLWKKVKIKKEEWKLMMDFISLLEIDGIDVLIADILVKAGISSASDLINAETADVVTRVRVVQDNNKEKIEQITAEMLNAWKGFKEKYNGNSQIKEGI
ncbi:MAG: DUF4332 domain-containing protein [Candidatus Hodarchaeota archaeon]